MAPMFVGRTAITDHAMKSENQIARTYEAYVETVQGKFNSLGMPYKILKAKSYMPRTQKNAALIEEIEAGIKKEVSVSCSVKKKVCSVCGKSISDPECFHTVGNIYEAQKCHTVLSDVSDVYEWSFVAVPAQKNAGVTKSFTLETGEMNMNELKKAFADAKDKVIISKSSAQTIIKYMDELEKKAEGFDAYRSTLADETIKLFAIVLPEASEECMKKTVQNLSADELVNLKKALENKANEAMPMTLQLNQIKTERHFDDDEYDI
jgi:hypothetical protein